MTTKSDELTALQIKALPYLLECRSYEIAAKSAGVSIKQIYVWLKQPTFKNELNRLRGEVTSGVVNQLRKGALKAVDTMVACLESNDERIRLKAAEHILGSYVKYNEMTNMEERLEALESELINGSQHQATD